MGDALMNLPAIRLLRQAYPKAWLSVLLDKKTAPLFEGHPDIDEALVIDFEKFKKNFLERVEWFKKIKKNGFDLVIISNPQRSFNLLCFFAGIRHRVGYRRKWGFLLTRTLPDKKKESGQHEIENNLDLLRLVGNAKVTEHSSDIPLLLRKPTNAWESAKEKIESLLDKNCPGGEEIIAIHPGTSNPTKRWPLKCWAELCDRLGTEASRVLILIGGNEELSLSEEMIKETRIPPLNWTGNLNLKELAAFFNHPRVRLLVSSDSGPLHVAWMSGTPVVGLYAKNDEGSNPARWGPRDIKSEVIYNSMDLISSEEVFSAARRVLEK
jgi:ADP-heptose:LPS heptosyltransferase